MGSGCPLSDEEAGSVLTGLPKLLGCWAGLESDGKEA